MVSSIAVSMPGVGAGPRPTSIISTTSTLDEGGFNEPSPEINALKSYYDYSTEATKAYLEETLIQEQMLIKNQKPLFIDTEIKESYETRTDDIVEAINHEKLLQCTNEITSAKNINMQFNNNNEILDNNVSATGGEDQNLSIEPFLVSRTILRDDVDDDVQGNNNVNDAEASILDLNDVQFADAESDQEDDDTSGKGKSLDTTDIDTEDGSVNLCSSDSVSKKLHQVEPADTMTPDEAENLLSSRYV